ncbi:hypothetical protein RIF29_05057 [Crotalaria pallida]|uniref:Uncharacterized protein n=1 Tax=Crotalaria pallida TaxID=3830 RepID=A0AAN9PAD8_CROPI
MATLIKLSVFVVFLVVLLSNSEVLISSTTEPTISASPGVLPYVTAPDISSFFPTTTPTANQPINSAAAPEAEEPVPAPSSGEFEGKKSSTSARLDSAAAIVAILLFSFLISSITSVNSIAVSKLSIPSQIPNGNKTKTYGVVYSSKQPWYGTLMNE